MAAWGEVWPLLGILLTALGMVVVSFREMRRQLDKEVGEVAARTEADVKELQARMERRTAEIHRRIEDLGLRIIPEAQLHAHLKGMTTSLEHIQRASEHTSTRLDELHRWLMDRERKGG